MLKLSLEVSDCKPLFRGVFFDGDPTNTKLCSSHFSMRSIPTSVAAGMLLMITQTPKPYILDPKPVFVTLQHEEHPHLRCGRVLAQALIHVSHTMLATWYCAVLVGGANGHLDLLVLIDGRSYTS